MDINLKLDPTFFNEEIRNGYTVTKDLKKLWAVELDLLSKFDGICKKHNLKYCVGAGTLLGTIRHKGFIPWDDDLDLYMLREDYDKLILLNDEFQSPYFLQNSYTEPCLLKTFSRLRNSTTMGSTKRDLFRNINNGIFIDIFPLDGISPQKMENHFQRLENKFRGCLFEFYSDIKSNQKPKIHGLKGYIYNLMVKAFIRDKEKFFGDFENNLKKYSTPKYKMWGNRTLVFDCPKSRRPLSDYQDLIYMPFECLQVPVPRNYDAMLRQQYGDYMKIPENKNQNMHGELIVSTDYAYDDPRRNKKI